MQLQNKQSKSSMMYLITRKTKKSFHTIMHLCFCAPERLRISIYRFKKKQKIMSKNEIKTKDVFQFFYESATK